MERNERFVVGDAVWWTNENHAWPEPQAAVITEVVIDPPFDYAVDLVDEAGERGIGVYARELKQRFPSELHEAVWEATHE